MFDFSHILCLASFIRVYGILEPPKMLYQDESDWCADSDSKCVAWSKADECSKNPAWMMTNCKKSCQSCQGGESAWKLRSDLATGYDNRSSSLRLFVDGRVSVHSMFIDRIIVEERAQTVRMHGKMVLTWNDSRVSWNPQKYHLSWLTFYWPQIWTPEIRQSNTPTNSLSSTSSVLLAANYTGKVFMWLDFAFTAPVDFKYADFPFDSQKVCFNLDNKRSYAVRFEISDLAQQEAVESAKQSNSPGWIVTELTVNQRLNSIQVIREWNRDPLDIKQSSVDICLTLKRGSSYVSFELVAPALIPALVTLISFVLGDFRKQIYLLLASLALQILAIYPVHALLPPATDSTPFTLKFFTFNATMTCLALVIALILYGLSQMRGTLPPPRCLEKFSKILQHLSRFCCLFHGDLLDYGKKDTDQVNIAENSEVVSRSGTKEAEQNKETGQWELFAISLKCLIFVIFIILYIVVLFVCFIF